MATTVTPVPTVTTATQSWIKQHERIVCLALILLVSGYGLNRVYDVEAARADAKYVAALQQVADAKANAAAAALTTANTQAQYTALVHALAVQNASLNASIAQRTASQAVTKKTDAALPVAGVAARWNDVAGTLVTPSGDTIVVSIQDGHKTLDILELVPVLQANLADQTKACVAQVAAIKADARKGKAKWFKLGFLGGFLTGLYAGHVGL